MDKNAIKKYAVWARRELISRVSQKALQYGITSEKIEDAADSINGKLLTKEEKAQRAALIKHIKENGYEQVMEEVAYTWFNRFCALRFMEVNGYLPTHVRVFSDEENNFKPQILTEAINLDLSGLNIEKVYRLKNDNKTEELYKYLIITQCNALNSVLPLMFQRISDYTELLFPDNLLREGSVIERLVSQIPEEDWKDAVQIIGWLYQYYITELNELVYDGNMAKERITSELLPAATTIYTPDWCVRYMVENSLGKLWIEGHPDSHINDDWKYYVDEAEQEESVKAKLAVIREQYAKIEPKEIKCIDPCMGSGHILVYMFDVLVQIYNEYGYSSRDAAAMITENNLFGLDIDDRAAQLAYFAVMMRGCKYDRRFLERGVQPRIYSIQESNHLSSHTFEYIVGKSGALRAELQKVVDAFHDAKEYGSILEVPSINFDLLYKRFDEIIDDISLYQRDALENFLPLVKQAEVLARKYDVIVTNPPYLSSSRFSSKLDSYVKEKYADEKGDISMVMYIRALQSLVQRDGYVAFITTSSWMFLSSFEKVRKYVDRNATIISLVDFGTELFDGKVGHNPIVSWVTRATSMNFTMTAIRLVDYCYARRDEKESEFFNATNRYYTNQSNFSKIPGSPIAYWVSERMISVFIKGTRLGDIADSKQGIATADNNKYLRVWYEIDRNKIYFSAQSHEEAKASKKKWFPYNKGGEFRKWYGNNDYVVEWENDGVALRNDKKAVLRNPSYYFLPCFSWSLVSSGVAAFRYKPQGHLFDVAGMSCFSRDNLMYLLAFCNTVVVMEILKFIAPTINYQCGDIANLPVILNRTAQNLIEEKTRNCIELSKSDWDSFETSWDFKKHPLI